MHGIKFYFTMHLFSRYIFAVYNKPSEGYTEICIKNILLCDTNLARGTILAIRH